MLEKLTFLRSRLLDNFNKDPVKLFLEAVSATWAISIFLGVIIQMNALSYPDLAFFSFTQAINDGAYIFAFLFSVFLGWVVGYFIAPMLWKLLNLVKGDRAYLFSAVLMSVVVLRFLYLLLEFSKGISNNMVSFGLIAMLYALLTISATLVLYIFFSSVFSKTDRHERIDVWLKGMKHSLITIFLFIFFVFAAILIRDMPKDINKFHCVEWDNQLLGIEYLNDKYVFTTNKLVLKNEDRIFYRNMDCTKAKIDFFIKKDNECIKVDGFDKDFISVSKIGLVSNKGYDFYTNRECKTK